MHVGLSHKTEHQAGNGAGAGHPPSRLGTQCSYCEMLTRKTDGGETAMKITNLGHALALAGVLSLGAAFSLDVQAAEYKPKAEVKSLHQGALNGVAGKTVIIKHFTLPAGFVGGKHFHPADVFVYVLEGELTVETEKNRAR